MTLDEFKTFLAVHLWKVGDDVVLSHIETLIKIAEAELNRALKIEDRLTVIDITVEDTTYDLPADFKTLRKIWSPTDGDMNFLALSEYADRQAYGQLTPNDYTISHKTLRFNANATAENPEDYQVWYIANIPSLIDGDSWVVDDYLDIYTYAVLKHSAPFLREDERLVTWGALYKDAIESALEENEHEKKFAGTPLRIKFPKGVR